MSDADICGSYGNLAREVYKYDAKPLTSCGLAIGPQFSHLTAEIMRRGLVQARPSIQSARSGRFSLPLDFVAAPGTHDRRPAFSTYRDPTASRAYHHR
jgi:hypothetical protein